MDARAADEAHRGEVASGTDGVPEREPRRGRRVEPRPGGAL